jgi:RNA polymerase sigma factor (sigma-70 family)
VHTTTQLAAAAMRDGTPAARVAHAALFERVVERIHRYFRRLVGGDADDCVQRTLLLLEESLRSKAYDADRSFNTWMWLKAHTVYAQWCRDRGRAPKALPEVDGQPQTIDDQDPALARERELDAATVLEAIRTRLGDETHEAFVLYYEGGLTQAEVAATLGRDRKTVAKRLAEAHALIDRMLGQAPPRP